MESMTQAMIPSGDEINARLAMARDLVGSGLLPKHVSTPQQCLAIMQMGSEMNLPPMMSLNKIYVIHGRPAIDGQTMLALLQRQGVMIEVKESTDKKCTVEARRYYGHDPRMDNENLWVKITETFTIADAQKMGMLNKDQYKKQPRIMLRWRAISGAARIIAADHMNGMYVQEEVESQSPFQQTETTNATPDHATAPALQIDSVTARPDATRIPSGAEDAPTVDDNPVSEPVDAVVLPTDAEVISQAQQKRLWAIARTRAKELDVDGDFVVRTVLGRFEMESTKEIKKSDYDDIIRHIEKFDEAKPEPKQGEWIDG